MVSVMSHSGLVLHDLEDSASKQCHFDRSEHKDNTMKTSNVSMTLILDKDMVITDIPCTSATLIAQYPERYFALAITAQGKCVLGFEGERQVSLNMQDLVDLFREKSADTLQ
jgi:hypothetical protein